MATATDAIMGTTTLLRFPEELFREIMTNSTKHDTYENRKALGCLRLAGSRDLTARVTPLLLSTVGFWFSLKSLGDLDVLAENAV